MRQLRAVIMTLDGTEVSCPVLKVDSFMIPAQGKIVGQVEVRAMTVLTVLHPFPGADKRHASSHTIMAVDAAKARIVIEEVLDASAWQTFS